MNFFTVSLFGHRVVYDMQHVGDALIPLVRELLRTKAHVVFLVGRNGGFDEYVASLIKQERKNTDKENCDVTLVLPYKVADMEYYEKYYAEMIIYESDEKPRPKRAIAKRNRWLVDQADLEIAHPEK